MKSPRMSLLALMSIVGIVAVNLAAGRALFPKYREVLPGCVLSGVVLQLAVVRLVYGRGPRRVFWAGFVLAGSLAVASLLFPESQYWTVWYRYFVTAGEWLRYFPELFGLVMSDRRALVVVRALIVFLPQLTLAVLGGLLALCASRCLGQYHDSAPRPAR
jgi:hypothetical protein